MNWISWTIVLIAWPLAGLAVAYLFGGFIRGVEATQNASDLVPPVLSYLRPNKRGKISTRVRTAAAKVRREVTAGRRVH